MMYASRARQSQAKIVHRFILFTRFILILPGKCFFSKTYMYSSLVGSWK